MCGRLGVFPHEASNSDVLPIGDLLIVCTSNGRNEGHTRVPSPRAPSLIAVDKRSGNVVWRAVGRGRARVARAMVQPRRRRRGRPNAGALRRGRRLAARRTTPHPAARSGASTATRRTPAGFRAPASLAQPDHRFAGL